MNDVDHNASALVHGDANTQRMYLQSVFTKENLPNRRVSRADPNKASKRTGSNDSGQATTLSGQAVQGKAWKQKSKLSCAGLAATQVVQPCRRLRHAMGHIQTLYLRPSPGAGGARRCLTPADGGLVVIQPNVGHPLLHPLNQIPYRGSGPAMVDPISGNTQVMFETMPSALQHIRAGSVRAIAVTGNQRAGYLPSVPPVVESGAPNYDATSWYGLFAPAGHPGLSLSV